MERLHFGVFVAGDDWAGKYDYLKDMGVSVVYFPYGEGVSSTSLKKKIYDNYDRIKAKTDHHIPSDFDAEGGGAAENG